jgi:hypothetical protein
VEDFHTSAAYLASSHPHLLARVVGKCGKFGEVLLRVAADELMHYRVLREITGRCGSPRLRARLYAVLYLVFGLTFTKKLAKSTERAASIKV